MAACPDSQLQPRFGAHPLSQNMLDQGQELDVVAGGAYAASDCPRLFAGTDMPGHFDVAPSVRFFLEGVGALAYL